MTTKINSRIRKKLYRQVVARDGEHCKNCGAKPAEKSLILEHINNNSSDNRLENLQIYCRSCNYKKNPRKGPVDNVCVSVCEEARAMTPEMTENRRMEPLFRNWLFEKVRTRVQIRWEEAINDGAERVGASTETIRRYLKKMTSNEGLYVVTRDSQGYPCIQFKNSI